MVDTAAEFDAFAERAPAIHRENIRISGEEPEFFAKYKIDELRRRWTDLRKAEPVAVLDFGCGVGASLPHLARSFPGSSVAGIDVSQRSLALARVHIPTDVVLHHYDGDILPLAPKSQDLIFTACVFHHIVPDARLALIGQLRVLLRPGGSLVIFEHNPLNPLTQYIVATCPFDENAVLLPAKELVDLHRQAGFDDVQTRYIGFFPKCLAALRRFESALGTLPLGAQYYTLADA